MGFYKNINADVISLTEEDADRLVHSLHKDRVPKVTGTTPFIITEDFIKTYYNNMYEMSFDCNIESERKTIDTLAGKLLHLRECPMANTTMNCILCKFYNYREHFHICPLIGCRHTGSDGIFRGFYVREGVDDSDIHIPDDDDL